MSTFDISETDNFLTVWSNVSYFLNQNELLNLALVSKKLYDKIALPKLYNKIHITKNPILRVEGCYLDCNTTYISGYRSIQKTNDQNDLFLFDRIEQFISVLEKHSHLVKEFILDDSIFTDISGTQQLVSQLISIISNIQTIEKILIRDPMVSSKFTEKKHLIESLKYLELYNFMFFEGDSIASDVTSMKINIDSSFDPTIIIDDSLMNILINQLDTLEILLTDEHLNFMEILELLNRNKVLFKNVRALKFSFTHFQDDTSGKLIYDYFSQTFEINNIEKLEINFCCHIEYCNCIDNFLELLAPQMEKLNKIALADSLYQNKGDNTLQEHFDASVGKFLLCLPNYETQLKELCIRHDPPLNGLGTDTVEGNYYRRRKFYEEILPNFKSLEKLIVPRMLQSISLYEIIVCDLLWNGCTCSHCKKYLPYFDEYLMNHQYYSRETGSYEDIIPPVMFGYVGDMLDQRNRYEIDWDLNCFKYNPVNIYWNFHGYEQIHHFHNYKCNFDENIFHALLVCVAHFFNGYMDHLVAFLPSLKVAMLSGFYYTIADKELYLYNGIQRRYKCIYDQ
ncbi:similar to Saccharomyces cerevisiae YMR258C ROY1 GTPase inhibitor with similarity to F-box proteins [Maudiozyma barnettii]|uniref:Similar to Saccharomyces cerevisiae YMR258C ROY1 GTPase inhibitor with similarity to F-box proteins n=1 Tax=Maudiozyma barnettii TaxID=61262 RepID=A0A8H2VCB5_9SACH|nr:Roy1p [Kazachstania barnettii]CAB4252644.1 similar to Saccharomyces cerevisiae YMR258C ROY1 GTPase inhibitor with similarity to F-box proteins [Kazachstania barnettii]CAD1780116.1 similar to Saccharomyces cerevisiae YMR258C ROY1 GTPase inhibitor with similarity to F-box proteins [Kazachstania barnettii]